MALTNVSCKAVPTRIRSASSHSLQVPQLLLQEPHQRLVAAAADLQDELQLGLRQIGQAFCSSRSGAGHRQHVADRVGQAAHQTLLGHVAGGPDLQGLDRDLLAAVGGHQDHGHGRKVRA